MKILLKCILATIILGIMRFFYVKVVNVPFFEGVFISSILGTITSIIIIEGIVIKKLSKSKNRR